MDYKKSKAPVNTVTRNIMDLCEETGNIYESVAIISKRSNQIAAEIKQDLNKKLQEFASYTDTLEEVFENREQIEISRYYEKLPKPTLLATQEFVDGNIYWRDPSQEKANIVSVICSTLPLGTIEPHGMGTEMSIYSLFVKGDNISYCSWPLFAIMLCTYPVAIMAIAMYKTRKKQANHLQQDRHIPYQHHCTASRSRYRLLPFGKERNFG